jgi:hypothetical protein
MSTSQALAILDISSSIAEKLDTKTDLLALALTRSWFLEPAIAILWKRHQHHLTPLVKILPSKCWVPVSDNKPLCHEDIDDNDCDCQYQKNPKVRKYLFLVSMV